jgi:hypothetical protein
VASLDKMEGDAVEAAIVLAVVLVALVAFGLFKLADLGAFWQWLRSLLWDLKFATGMQGPVFGASGGGGVPTGAGGVAGVYDENGNPL